MKIRLIVSTCAALLLSGCMSYSNTYGYRDYRGYDAPVYYDDGYRDGYYDGYYRDDYDRNGYYDSWYYDRGYYDPWYDGGYYGGSYYRDPFAYYGNSYCWSYYDCQRDPFASFLAFGGSHFWLLFGDVGWPNYYGYGYGHGWPYWNDPYWGYPYPYWGYPGYGWNPPPPHHPPPRDNGSHPGRPDPGPSPAQPRSNGSYGNVHGGGDHPIYRDSQPIGERDNGSRGNPDSDTGIPLPTPRPNGARPGSGSPGDRGNDPRLSNGGGNYPPIRWRAPQPMPTPMPPRDSGQIRYPVAPIDRGGGGGPIVHADPGTPMPPRDSGQIRYPVAPIDRGGGGSIVVTNPGAPRMAPPPPSAPVVRPVRPVQPISTPTPVYEPSVETDDTNANRTRRRGDGSGDGR